MYTMKIDRTHIITYLSLFIIGAWMKSKNCNDLIFSPGSRFGRLHPQGAASILGDLMGDVANDEKKWGEI